MDFHVGDRVEYTREGGTLHPGDTGLVVRVEGGFVGVRWDRPIRLGHTCKGACDDGYGRWVFDNEIAHETLDTFEPSTDDELLRLLSVSE